MTAIQSNQQRYNPLQNAAGFKKLEADAKKAKAKGDAATDRAVGQATSAGALAASQLKKGGWAHKAYQKSEMHQSLVDQGVSEARADEIVAKKFGEKTAEKAAEATTSSAQATLEGEQAVSQAMSATTGASEAGTQAASQAAEKVGTQAAEEAGTQVAEKAAEKVSEEAATKAAEAAATESASAIPGIGLAISGVVTAAKIGHTLSKSKSGGDAVGKGMQGAALANNWYNQAKRS